RMLRVRARRTVGHALYRAADDIGHQRARARALSPLATLQRGYAVLQDADGHVVTSVAGVAERQQISVRVADGRVHATTTSTEEIDAPQED
ncbi:MAG: exodeoxyribonuclease VII large subunit, partial [Nocardioides sp.]